MERATLKTFLPIFLIGGIFLITGCATLNFAELDDANPQGAKTLTLGGGIAMYAPVKSDETAEAQGIYVRDDFYDFSATGVVRYGLTESVDVNGALVYSTYPGFGIRFGMKKSFPLTSSLNGALFGSAYYFITNNEEPDRDDAVATYNRKFAGITLGAVASLNFPRADFEKPGYFHSVSLGAKFTASYCDARWSFSNLDPPVAPYPRPEYDPQHKFGYFYTATPYLVVSSHAPRQSIFIEVQSPFTNYDNFNLASVQSWQVSVGVRFIILDLNDSPVNAQ